MILSVYDADRRRKKPLAKHENLTAAEVRERRHIGAWATRHAPSSSHLTPSNPQKPRHESQLA